MIMIMMTMAMINVDEGLIKSAGILSFRGHCALVLLVECCPRDRFAVVAGGTFHARKYKMRCN